MKNILHSSFNVSKKKSMGYLLTCYIQDYIGTLGVFHVSLPRVVAN